MTLNLEVLPGNYVVCRFEPGESIPAWACGELVSVTRTPDELSIVCRDEEVPADVQSEPGWRSLRIAGTLDFSLVGVVARITTVLADTGVSVLVISTFDTDYFLVRDIDLERGVKALLEAGFLFPTQKKADQ
ncbi:MAG: ACT domain-containing protein [Planctomycetota bacterium]|nr:ACT domain-containing protein [Planctomycetota bacterium]